MQEPMFLKPVFQEKIWGGSRLRSVFGFDIPNDKIGEDINILNDSDEMNAWILSFKDVDPKEFDEL